jgi:hypothetical protein
MTTMLASKNSPTPWIISLCLGLSFTLGGCNGVYAALLRLYQCGVQVIYKRKKQVDFVKIRFHLNENIECTHASELN